MLPTLIDLIRSTMLQASARPLMHISHVDVGNSVLGKAFIEAGHELSVTFKNLSFSAAHNTVFKGRRWSSLDGYLRPALGRHNLHVLLKTQVTRVMRTITNTYKHPIPLPVGLYMPM
jgi:choline dehydrogenase-like flavoprotein